MKFINLKLVNFVYLAHKVAASESADQGEASDPISQNQEEPIFSSHDILQALDLLPRAGKNKPLRQEKRENRIQSRLDSQLANEINNLPKVNPIDEIIDQIEQDMIEPRKTKLIVDMIYAVINTKYSKKAISFMIRDYGCYCFNTKNSDGNYVSGGYGPPVDHQDKLCQKLSQCHTCINKDYNSTKNPTTKQKIITCDPETINYTFKVNSNKKTITCDDNQNVDPCQKNTCECDKNFALEFALTWNDNNFNHFYWKNEKNMKQNLTFDANQICKKQDNLVMKDACCGSYPERLPFNSFLHECCSDGSIKSLGSC